MQYFFLAIREIGSLCKCRSACAGSVFTPRFDNIVAGCGPSGYALATSSSLNGPFWARSGLPGNAEPGRERPMDMSAISIAHAKSRTPEGLAKRGRSRVTNGNGAFIRGDGRSLWTRRWKDLIELHARDISPNGAAHLSEAQKSLIRRAATLEIEMESIEGRLSEGGPGDLSTYAAAAGHLKRILELLGIERRQKDVPTLSDILQGPAPPT